MRVTPASIRRWRVTDPGTLPPFFTIGTGPKAKMRFPRDGVERWLERQLSAQRKSDEPLQHVA